MKTQTKELAKEMYAAMNGAAIEDMQGFIERTVLAGINMTADGDMTENGKPIAHVEKRPDYRGKPQEPTVWDAGDWELYRKFERNLSTAQELKSLLHIGYAEKVVEQVVDGVKRNRMKGELEKFVEHEGVASWQPDGEPATKTPYPEPSFGTEKRGPIELSGKTVAITGRLYGMDKAMAAKRLAAIGARFADSVTKSVDVLVQADDTNTKGKSSKLKKAEKYGIEVIDEPTFKAAIEKRKAPKPEPPKTEPKAKAPKPEPTPKAPKAPKGKDDGTHNGMTWKERVEVGLRIARESGGRIKAEWKGRNVETAWLWLRAANGVEGTNPFTKAETKQLKFKGGAGFRYKKYGEGAQYEEGTVMWYLPYPNTMRHRIGKGHKQYTTFDDEEREAA